jgi:hypothetical protein
MENQPFDTLLIQLLQLPIQDINRLCQTNTHFYNNCKTPILWIKLLKRDFPGAEIGPGEDPKERYHRELLFNFILKSYPKELYISHINPPMRVPFDMNSYQEFVEKQREMIESMDSDELDRLEFLRLQLQLELKPMLGVSLDYPGNGSGFSAEGFAFDVNGLLILLPEVEVLEEFTL